MHNMDLEISHIVMYEVCMWVMLHFGAGRSRGGQARAGQLGTEGYQEMGKKGGLATTDMSGGEAAAEKGIKLDESKFTKN